MVGAIDGAPVVHACLAPSGDAIALVAETGGVAVVDMATGAVSAQLETSTSRFGVAWPSEGQLARLVAAGDAEPRGSGPISQRVPTTRFARLDATGAWKLTTAGTGC